MSVIKLNLEASAALNEKARNITDLLHCLSDPQHRTTGALDALIGILEFKTDEDFAVAAMALVNYAKDLSGLAEKARREGMH